MSEFLQSYGFFVLIALLLLGCLLGRGRHGGHGRGRLKLTLPGFRWLSVGSFFLGLVESFLYGAYAGVVFVPIYNFVLRRYR